MPLGAFRLNGIAKYFAPTGLTGWAGYDGSLDPATTFDTTSKRGIHAVSDSLFITSDRDGGELKISVWTRSGTTISKSYTTSVIPNIYIGNENGLFLLLGTSNYAYFVDPDYGRLVKLNNITSSNISVSNTLLNGGITGNRIVANYVDTANGDIVLYMNQNQTGITRKRTTVSGTTTITATTATHTYSGVTGVLKAISVIDNTKALAITLDGNNLRAYYLNGNTASQVGSTITSSGTYQPTTASILASHVQQQTGGVCTYANYTGSSGIWNIFYATTSGFNSYQVSAMTNAFDNAWSVTNHPDEPNIAFFYNHGSPGGAHFIWSVNHNTQSLGNISTNGSYSDVGVGANIESWGIRYLSSDYMLAWGNTAIRLLVKP